MALTNASANGSGKTGNHIFKAHREKMEKVKNLT